MNLKLVSRIIGLALLLNAIFMFISAAVSIVYGVDDSFSPLILSGIIENRADEVREVFESIGLCFFGSEEENGWLALGFQKMMKN